MAFLKKNKTTEEPKKETAPQAKTAVHIQSSVLVRPVVTEKSTSAAAENKYVFHVAKNATKVAVAQAIQAAYGTRPASVNMQNVRGKVVRRGKIVGTRSAWKKAVVSMPKGTSLNIYEGV